MKITVDMALAAGRNVVSGLGGAAVVFGIMSTSQNADVATGFEHIFNGVKEIASGVLILVPVAMAVWGARTSTPLAKILSTGAMAGVTVVAPHDLAKAAADAGAKPDDVKSANDVKIIAK
jgi:hypothetical protein